MTSATDELRRLLDERGVEHYDGTERTLWGYEQTGENTGIYRFAASEINGGYLQFDMFRITPEEAIAATLGNDAKPCYATDYTHARCKYSVNRGWTEDTKFYVPTATPGRGTCKLDGFADVRFSVDYEVEGYAVGSSSDYATLEECSSCGAYVIEPPAYHHALTCDGDEIYQPYNYCPNCGARVERREQ